MTLLFGGSGLGAAFGVFVGWLLGFHMGQKQ